MLVRGLFKKFSARIMPALLSKLDSIWRVAIEKHIGP